MGNISKQLENMQQQLVQQMTDCPWLDGQHAKLIHLRNQQGMQVSFMDIGATWLSCLLPTAGGLREVLLRSANMQQHLQDQSYCGAIVGRYANRIKQGRFQIGAHTYHVDQNEGSNCLHGGQAGFSKKRWQISSQSTNKVVFHYFSADGEQGFPGDLDVSVHYTLTEENRLSIDYYAQCTRDCPVSLTNHAYFNLAGDERHPVLDDYLQIKSQAYLPVDEQMLPTGEWLPVIDTLFDFNHKKPIKRHFFDPHLQQTTHGYDHCFVLAPDCPSPQIVLTSAQQDVGLHLTTSYPAAQLYTGNFLANLIGPNGRYRNHAGIALETQQLPDGPNQAHWYPFNGILLAGELDHQYCHFDFHFNGHSRPSAAALC